MSIERIAWVLIVALASSGGYLVGKNSKLNNSNQLSVGFTSETADVSNEIDKSFGWAKAPNNINVEAVNVVKGIRPGGDDYPHRMPSVTFTLKNVGDSDLESFGVSALILDENNKQRIAYYSQASGSIRKGWTSEKILFEATQMDWKDAFGVEAIDCPVTMTIFVNTLAGKKEILKVSFDTSEIERLPVLDY